MVFELRTLNQLYFGNWRRLACLMTHDITLLTPLRACTLDWGHWLTDEQNKKFHCLKHEQGGVRLFYNSTQLSCDLTARHYGERVKNPAASIACQSVGTSNLISSCWESTSSRWYLLRSVGMLWTTLIWLCRHVALWTEVVRGSS